MKFDNTINASPLAPQDQVMVIHEQIKRDSANAGVMVRQLGEYLSDPEKYASLKDIFASQRADFEERLNRPVKDAEKLRELNKVLLDEVVG